MKKLLFILAAIALFTLSASGVFAQVYTNSYNYGNGFNRGSFDSSLAIPVFNDTPSFRSNLTRSGVLGFSKGRGKMYLFTGTKWNPIADSAAVAAMIGSTAVTRTSQLTNDVPFLVAADIGNKVDKVTGMGLSTNDYSNSDRTKVASVQTGATANSTDAYLLNRANHTGTQAASTITGLGTAAPLNVAGSGNATSSQVVVGNDTRLSDARPPTAHTHAQGDVIGLANTLAAKSDTSHTHPTGKIVGLDSILSSKAGITSPTFYGSPSLPGTTIGVTQSPANSTTALATTAFVTTANNLKADLSSPSFTGSPQCPTPPAGTASNRLATTLFSATADNLTLGAIPAGRYAAGTIPLGSLAQGTATTGQVVQWNGTTWVPATVSSGGGSGTVSSVAVSVPSAFSVSGSPITSSGTIAINATGSTSQYIDGTGALATFPTFNQNTTGTSSNVTGVVAIANGGTGKGTQQTAINNLTGTQGAGRYLRSDGTNATLMPIQPSDVPTLNQNTTGSAGTVATISGLLAAGTNTTISGVGTSASPYAINAPAGLSGLTANYLPKATSATAIGNSQVYDNGTSVRVGGSYSPLGTLDVSGQFFVRGGSVGAYFYAGTAIPIPVWQGTTFLNSGTSDVAIQPYGGRLGIGNTAPLAMLDVTGTVKIADGTQAAGKVFTSDANGLGSWQVSAMLDTPGRKEFTATAGQTSFSPSFTIPADSSRIAVYRNGILVSRTLYSTTPTAVTFNSGTSAGDNVIIYRYSSGYGTGSSTYVLPVATTSTLGGVKVDGLTLGINSSTGVVSVIGGGSPHYGTINVDLNAIADLGYTLDNGAEAYGWHVTYAPGFTPSYVFLNNASANAAGTIGSQSGTLRPVSAYINTSSITATTIDVVLSFKPSSYYSTVSTPLVFIYQAIP